MYTHVTRAGRYCIPYCGRKVCSGKCNFMVTLGPFLGRSRLYISSRPRYPQNCHDAGFVFRFYYQFANSVIRICVTSYTTYPFGALGTPPIPSLIPLLQSAHYNTEEAHWSKNAMHRQLVLRSSGRHGDCTIYNFRNSKELLKQTFDRRTCKQCSHCAWQKNKL